MSAGKVYPLRGQGSFLQSRQALLAAFLLRLGYRIAGPKCYKDITDLGDGSRTYVFAIDGGQKLRFGKTELMAAEAAEMIRGDRFCDLDELTVFRDLYAIFPEPTPAPVATLRNLGAPQVLVAHFAGFLEQVGEVRKHVRIKDYRGSFDLFADMSPEQMEIEMDRLSG